MVISRLKKLACDSKSLLKQGVSPQKLAVGLTIGGIMGIIPLLGISTMLCLGLAVALRLSIPITQLANYAVYPLQLLLIGIYYSAGAWLFSDSQLAVSPGEILGLLKNDLSSGVRILKDYTLYAVGAWIITCPLIAVIIYLPTVRLLTRLAHQIKKPVVKI